MNLLASPASSGHNIIVIGTSAGGLKALRAVLSALPSGFEASIFVVQHLAPDKPSRLPKLLAEVCQLPVCSPRDHQRFLPGHIYVAAPDFQMLVNQDHVRILRGPQENRFRPSIDALFRSAARAHGSRVIGVILTGYRDDGTVGLQAIKKRGGMCVVQDPDEAEYPSMPKTALRNVKVDHTVPIGAAGALLVRLAAEPAADQAGFPVSPELEIESNIAEQLMTTREFLESVERIGKRTSYTCPDCTGAIWQIGDEEPFKLRCHVGHSFTGEVFSAEQSRNIEHALWTAIRTMEEKITFLRELARRKHSQNLPGEAGAYELDADALDTEVSQIRELIVRARPTPASSTCETG